jgi:hypothetical protein
MPLTVTVYGASDDLAEIEGDFYDEFDADCNKVGVWVFSNGTKISMTMNRSGDWVLKDITPDDVVNTNEITFHKRPGYPRDGACTVKGDFTDVQWMKTETVSARKAVRQ